MRRVAVYALTIGIGLYVSAKYAEWPVNIWCLGLFAWLFKAAQRKERIEMLTVLAFATPMELFFSEVWLIYEYQRGLMPLFVPVGHWFLFDAGRRLSQYLAADKAMLVCCRLCLSRLRSMDWRRYFCSIFASLGSSFH